MRVPVLTISGHVGAGVTPGSNKTAIWDAGADMPGKTGNFKARVLADDGNSTDPMVMVVQDHSPTRMIMPIQCIAMPL